MHYLFSEDDDIKPDKRLTDQEFEELEQKIISHPLFSRDPKVLDEGLMEALKATEIDDTPENLAVYHNKKGNEQYKKGENQIYYLKEALKEYTSGIDAKSSDKEINAKLHNNRALIHIKNKNYGKAVEDAKKAIEYKPDFAKAYHRCATVLQTLNKLKEAIDVLETGIKIIKNQQDLNDLNKLLKDITEKFKKSIQQAEEKKQEKKQDTNLIYEECKARQLVLGKPCMDFPDGCRKSVFLDNGQMYFPVFVTYPEFQTMDYIEKVSETDYLIEHLAEVVGDGLPYDPNKIYNIDTIEVYIEFNVSTPLWEIPNFKHWPRQKGLKKVDLQKTALENFREKGYILPQVVEIIVISPKSKAFYDQFLQQT